MRSCYRSIFRYLLQEHAKTELFKRQKQIRKRGVGLDDSRPKPQATSLSFWSSLWIFRLLSGEHGCLKRYLEALTDPASSLGSQLKEALKMKLLRADFSGFRLGSHHWNHYAGQQRIV